MGIEFSVTKRYKPLLGTSSETPYSTVYRAIDLFLKREVIVKEIKIQGESFKERKRMEENILGEVKSLARAGNESTRVPSLFDYHLDEKNGKVYIIMQLIKGKTLREEYYWTPQRRPSMNEARRYLRQMGELSRILDTLSSVSLTHRDIKPENIIMSKEQSICLIDFNLSNASLNPNIGTPHYKAPEMDKNLLVANRTFCDMFSMGVMLYEFFTGIVPIRGEHYGLSTRASKMNKEWSHFREPKEFIKDLDEGINHLIGKLMAIDPSKRYRSYRELTKELEHIQKNLRGGR